MCHHVKRPEAEVEHRHGGIGFQVKESELYKANLPETHTTNYY